MKPTLSASPSLPPLLPPPSPAGTGGGGKSDAPTDRLADGDGDSERDAPKEYVGDGVTDAGHGGADRGLRDAADAVAYGKLDAPGAAGKYTALTSAPWHAGASFMSTAPFLCLLVAGMNRMSCQSSAL